MECGMAIASELVGHAPQTIDDGDCFNTRFTASAHGAIDCGLPMSGDPRDYDHERRSPDCTGNH
jgi:hypothetical protein